MYHSHFTLLAKSFYIPKISCISRSSSRSKSQNSSDDSSSEDDMDWNDDHFLLASLSIPQLDGTADENSGMWTEKNSPPN